MKKKRSLFSAFLVLEGLFFLALFWAGDAAPQWFSGALAFPFEQIGAGLRWLSLAGAAGNVLAILLYALLSLLPLGVLLVLRRRGALCREDCLLVLLTVLLFVTLYYMVNPALVPVPSGLGDGEGGKLLFGGSVYALVFGYGVLRALRCFRSADMGRLQDYLALFLKLLAVLFVFLACGSCFQDFLTSLDALRVGNQGNEGALLPSVLFLFARYLAAALPYVLDTLVTLAALKLLAERRKDPYSQETETAAQVLSQLCVVSLGLTVLVTVVLDLLQLLCLGSLYTVQITVLLPVLSIVFVLAVLLLTQLMGENRQLKEDNDLFI